MARLGYILDYKDNLQDLIAMILGHQEDLFKYMLLRREIIPPQEEGIKFSYFQKGEPFGQWTSGRLFSPEADLRWQKRGNYYHLTLLLCQDDLDFPEGFQIHKLQPAKDEEGKEKGDSSIFLWGEMHDFPEGKDPQYAWYEERIPHLILYPIEGKPKQVALRIKEYILEEEYILEKEKDHHASPSPIYHYKKVIGYKKVDEGSD